MAFNKLSSISLKEPDVDDLADRIVESLVSRYGPEATLGDIKAALDMKAAVEAKAEPESPPWDMAVKLAVTLGISPSEALKMLQDPTNIIAQREVRAMIGWAP